MRNTISKAQKNFRRAMKRSSKNLKGKTFTMRAKGISQFSGKNQKK